MAPRNPKCSVDRFQGVPELELGENYVNATNLKPKYSFSLTVNVGKKVIHGF